MGLRQSKHPRFTRLRILMSGQTTTPGRYASCFSLFKEADLVLESSDGAFFAVRSMYLKAASSVLDDILGIPAGPNQVEKDGHPLFKLDEKAAPLELFLRYVHRGRYVINGKTPEPSWDSLAAFCEMCDKYDAPITARMALLEQLPMFMGDPLVIGSRPRRGTVFSTNVFAIAAIHGLEDLAKAALRWHHEWETKSIEPLRTLSHRHPSEPYAVRESWRPTGLGDVRLSLLSRLSPLVIKSYCAFHTKVLVDPAYSWLHAGDDFTVSVFPRLILRQLLVNFEIPSHAFPMSIHFSCRLATEGKGN